MTNTNQPAQAAMTDEDILEVAKDNGIGWLDQWGISAFGVDEEDSRLYLQFARAIIARAEQAQAERIKELLSLNEALNTNLEAAQESISEQLEVGKGYLLTIAELLVVLKICANSGTGEWYPYSFEQGRTAAKKSIERMQGEKL